MPWIAIPTNSSTAAPVNPAKKAASEAKAAADTRATRTPLSGPNMTTQYVARQ